MTNDNMEPRESISPSNKNHPEGWLLFDGDNEFKEEQICLKNASVQVIVVGEKNVNS